MHFAERGDHKLDRLTVSITNEELSDMTLLEQQGEYSKGIMTRKICRQEEEGRYPKIEKCRIGIIGLTEGAGASFVTLALAKAISGYGLVPAVVELGKGGIYESLGMAERFAGREFFSFHQALHENRKIRNRSNFDEGINWALRGPGEDHIDLGATKMMRLMDNIQGEAVLCDFSGLDIDSVHSTLMKELLTDMESLVLVIDPLPSKLMKGYSTLARLSRISDSLTVVVNKYNRGVNRAEMLKLLKVRKPLYLPYVAPEEIYEAEYRCRIVSGSGPAGKLLNGPVKDLLKRAVPPDILRLG